MVQVELQTVTVCLHDSPFHLTPNRTTAKIVDVRRHELRLVRIGIQLPPAVGFRAVHLPRG